MTSDTIKTLADLCSDVSYGYTESANRQQVGPKFLRITDIQGGTIDWDSIPFCTATKQDEKKYSLEVGDIVVARTGNSTGENAQIISTPPLAVFASYLIRFRPDVKMINPFFVGYQLRTDRFKNYVLSVLGGSAQPGANARQLGAFPIQIIERKYQDSIVKMLQAVDSRISLLRETNATLEAIAQAIFKSWFVDFDPVLAKQAGRLPEGMDAETAKFFPDIFEQSELGEIPKGWQVGSIYDISKVIYGAPFASKLFKTTLPGLPLVRIRDLKDERPKIFTEEVHPKGYLLQPGDIVVGMDGEFRAYIWGGELAWLNQRLCIFQPINYSNSTFVRQSLMPLLALVEASETATTVIHLGKNDIDRFKVVLPNTVVLRKFADVTDPLYMQLVANKQYIQNLSKLRDTLLPRLISGQIRLADTKEQIEVAIALSQ
jgi:type I restriction enzyme S subunit